MKTMKTESIIFSFILILVLTSCSLFYPVAHTNPNDPDNPNRIYHVTYYANGATGSVPVDSYTYADGEKVSVPGSASLIKNGYAFPGWTTSTNGPGSSYTTGATFLMPKANVDLYAVWITNNLTFNFAGGAITISGGSPDPSGTLNIPCGVTTIGVNAFLYKNAITNLVLPPSITAIGTSAFYQCQNVKNLIMPSSLSSIGTSAFGNCTTLTNVAFLGANCSIGTSVFSGVATNFTITAPAGGTVQSYCAANGIFFY